MIPNAKCQTCVFHSPSRTKHGIGQCRSHSPILGMGDRGPRTLWPITHADDWCGDHATAEQGDGT